MPAGSLRRLMRRGPPASWSTEKLEALAQKLVVIATESERRRRQNPALQQLIERRRAQAAIEYTDEARRAALDPVRAALREFEARAECAYGSWTARAELARELGISSGRLGRWLEAGRVPATMMPLVSEWAARRIEQQLAKMARQQVVEDLVQRAKRPALAHGLPGAAKTQAARAPDIRDHQGPYENADVVGYKWDRRVEAFASFELIGKLEKWALSRRPPPNARLGRAKLWVVTALCSIYDPPDSLAPKDERRQRRRRSKSPGAYRQFERKVDKQQLGRDLMLGAAVSSRMVRRGGLERAVALWRANMVVETCENELVFIHGLIIRNWRRRGEPERDRYVKRDLERWEKRHRKEERAREREKRAVRQRARKKALGRGRSPSRKRKS